MPNLRHGSLSRLEEPKDQAFSLAGSLKAVNGDLEMRALGTGLILLFLTCASYGTTPSHEIRSVAISPDGKLIAVDVEKGSVSFIYTIPADTGIATRLTNAKDGEETSPAFSADGKRIAYTYWPGDHRRSRIVIVNVDGSNPHQWSPSNTDDLSPVFSSDNETIVFSRAASYDSSSPVAQPHPHEWNFYAARLDGTNVRQITNESFYMVSPASVSPDGKSIVVVTEGLEADRQIAVYSVDGPRKPMLTFRPHVPKEDDHKNPMLAYPNYLPDGKSILFMAASSGRRGYDYDVYRLEIGDGSLEKLTNRNGYATDLKVSADGTTAVFLKWRKNWLGELTTSELYLLDMQSRKLTPLKVTGLG